MQGAFDLSFHFGISPVRKNFDSRVLLVGNFLSESIGTRFVCEDLADRLAASGWSVVTTSDKRSRLPRLLDMISTVLRRRNDYSVAQIDIFSGMAFLWAELVCWILRRIGKLYVLTMHGGNLPTFARLWPRRVRRLLLSAAAVTAPSHYLHEQMKPYRPDILLLPNALEMSIYGSTLRKQSRSHLVWLRAFHTIYNPSLAPAVLAKLVNDYPDIHLTMVGPDKGDGSLQAMWQKAKDLGVADRIALQGRVSKSEISNWMNKGDIFLNTTNVDNTPITVLEAMACGLCVVSTNVGGIPYLLENEHDSVLVPPDDPEAMATAVRRILTEPGLAEHLSKNARAKAELFSWERILPMWQDLLRRTIRS